MGILAILWVAVVFSLAFGNAGDGGFIGNFDYAFLNDVRTAVRTTDGFLSFLTIRSSSCGDVRDHHARADHRRGRRPA